MYVDKAQGHTLGQLVVRDVDAGQGLHLLHAAQLLVGEGQHVGGTGLDESAVLFHQLGGLLSRFSWGFWLLF